VSRAALLFVVCQLVAGCASANGDGDAASSSAELCARATSHIRACMGGEQVTVATDCNAEVATQLLATDCATLQAGMASEKADGPFDVFGALACAVGFSRYCDQVTCTAPKYPGPSSACGDYIDIAGCGGCQFYACREAEDACGSDGYYLGFGEKYCERFLLIVKPRLSLAGEAFLDRGRDCLMRTIDAEIGEHLTCSQVRRQALDSHVACYRDNGFCELPLGDRLRLFLSVDAGDLDLKSAFDTQLACL